MNKTKKILSLLLSVVMLCTMFTAFSLTANAAGETPIEISDFAALQSTIVDATAGTPLTIDITADIMSGGDIYINDGKNITINLNGHTVVCLFASYHESPSTLTINGSGTIKGPDGEVAGNFAINFAQGSKFIANDVKIIGGSGTGENGLGRFGISLSSGATATINNCYVAAGKSIGSSRNSCAIGIYADAQANVKNCTFVVGSGGSGYTDNTIFLVDTGKLCDIDGNEITGLDYTQSPIVIGNGYANPVTGNVIKDTDGTPARADSPITAATTIPEPTYTVTIPASVDFGALTQALEKYRDKATDKNGEINPKKAFNVSASGVDNMFDGNKLFVTIGTAVNLTLENGTKTVPCKLYKGDIEYTVGSDFAVFNNDIQLKSGETNEQSGAISVNRCDLTEQGNYKGTITFNIEIKGAN